MTSREILFYCSKYAYIIPLLVGVIRYSHLPSTGKLFLAFMVFCGVTEYFAHYMAVKYHNNMPLLYVYTYVEFGVYVIVLLPRLVLFDRWRKQLIYALLLLMLGLLFTDIFIHTIFKLNSISRVSACVIIVFMSLSYLLQYLQSESEQRITRDYIFWIAAGAAIYFSISFFMMAMTNMATQHKSLWKIVSNSHLISSLIAYFFFAYGLMIVQKEKR